MISHSNKAMQLHRPEKWVKSPPAPPLPPIIVVAIFADFSHLFARWSSPKRPCPSGSANGTLFSIFFLLPVSVMVHFVSNQPGFFCAMLGWIVFLGEKMQECYSFLGEIRVFGRIPILNVVYRNNISITLRRSKCRHCAVSLQAISEQKIADFRWVMAAWEKGGGGHWSVNLVDRRAVEIYLFKIATECRLYKNGEHHQSISAFETHSDL